MPRTIKHYRVCVICGFRASRKGAEKRKFMARFPLDHDRCRQWVKAIGIEDLVYVPIEKLNELKFVCGDHFDPKDLNRKKSRLKKWSIPSLGIQLQPLPDELLLDFPCHVVKSGETTESCVVQPKPGRALLDLTNL